MCIRNRDQDTGSRNLAFAFLACLVLFMERVMVNPVGEPYKVRMASFIRVRSIKKVKEPIRLTNNPNTYAPSPVLSSRFGGRLTGVRTLLHCLSLPFSVTALSDGHFSGTDNWLTVVQDDLNGRRDRRGRRGIHPPAPGRDSTSSPGND